MQGSMHVIWKRPDGFHGALPEDFRRIALSNGGHLWAHKSEIEWYPFQVSGDWAGQDQTARLNRLVNLLDRSDNDWRQHLEKLHDDEMEGVGGVQAVAQVLRRWIETLLNQVKGHTWETDIISCALNDVYARLKVFADDGGAASKMH